MTTPLKDENRKGSMSGVPPKERRRSPRTKITSSEIVYMNFRSGNGGIVLDVSSAGLGFQAADRVDLTESLSFRFLAPAIEHIEISGQVTWLDKARKRGGLRLSHLPVEVRSEIQRWQRPSSPSVPNVKQPAAAKANRVLEDVNSAQSGGTPQTVRVAGDWSGSSLPARQRAPIAAVQLQRNPGATRTPFASALGPVQSADAAKSSPWDPPADLRARMYGSEWSSGGPRGEWHENRHTNRVPLIVALLLVAVGVVYFSFGTRQRAGEFLVRFGELVSDQRSKPSAQTPAATTASKVMEAPTTTVLPAAPSGAPESSDSTAQDAKATGGPSASSKSEAGQPAIGEAHASAAGTSSTDTDRSARKSEATYSPAQTDAKNIPAPSQPHGMTSTGSDNGEIELTQAHRYLRGAGPEDRAVAAQLLWVAVGKGNSQAELELADLYLRGAGTVPKNCEQARILLRAARTNDNSMAEERLAHLRDYGCR